MLRLHGIIIFKDKNMVEEISVKNEPYAAQAQLLKLLTHPARLAILNILRNGEHCVCHMEAHLGYRQAYISQQLMALREAGIIQNRRDGWNIFYHVAEPRIFDALMIIDQIVGVAPKTVSSDQDVLCSCPKCATGEGK
jgi:DNA-binding transcriptional ArsR family regulator